MCMYVNKNKKTEIQKTQQIFSGADARGSSGAQIFFFNFFSGGDARGSSGAQGGNNRAEISARSIEGVAGTKRRKNRKYTHTQIVSGNLSLINRSRRYCVCVCVCICVRLSWENSLKYSID